MQSIKQASESDTLSTAYILFKVSGCCGLERRGVMLYRYVDKNDSKEEAARNEELLIVQVHGNTLIHTINGNVFQTRENF
jgi:hypothetical protein